MRDAAQSSELQGICVQDGSTTTPEIVLGTHEQLRQCELPLHDCNHVFLAAAATHVDDNSVIDAVLRAEPGKHIHVFMVSHSGLQTEPNTDTAPQYGDIQDVPGPQIVAPPELAEKTGLICTTDLDADQAAMLEADIVAVPETRNNTEPGQAQTVGNVELEAVLMNASATVPVMEDPAHVAVVSQDRNSFVHRSKALFEHLVLVSCKGIHPKIRVTSWT